METVTFDASDIIRRVADAHPDWLMAVEVLGEGYRVNRPFPDGELSGRIWVETPEQLASERVTRVVLRDTNSTAAEFSRIAPNLNLHEVIYFIGYTAWLDIAPADVNKAYGLGRVCDRLGRPRRRPRRGDGFNDLEMFAFCGQGGRDGSGPRGGEGLRGRRRHRGGTGLVQELTRWF